MKINKTKVKEFISTHKKKIFYGLMLGGVSSIAYIAGRRVRPVLTDEAILTDPNYKDLGYALFLRNNGTKHVVSNFGDGISLENWNSIKKEIIGTGLPENTKVTGMIMYIDPENVINLTKD